jgi:alkylation response protein AidB-like acyl-CoA dehydrogenase
MDTVATSGLDDSVAARVAALVPLLRHGAARLDDAAGFPTEEIAALRKAGALALPLPVETDLLETDGRETLVDQLAASLVDLGRGNLSVGRIVEAHINARHLIARCGSPDQKAASASDTRNGELYALWVTDPPENGLRMTVTGTAIRLIGGKKFCSAAGHATRALVTAVNESGDSQMLVLALGMGETVERLAAPLQGMRAAVTGAVDFTGCVATTDTCLGKPGDYLREPDFSAGAWRSSAVALGGLCSLLEMTTAQLKEASRLGNPHHLQRLGTAMIACETSRLWLHQVAWIAENPSADLGRIVAYTGLARIAIETACLDAMRLVQRSLGLSAFRRGNPIERVCRDLSTYLRQPAPDEVLAEAAAYFAGQPVPDWS